MKVRYARRARADIEDILSFLDSRSATGTQNVRRVLITTIAMIGRFPGLGRLAGEGHVRVVAVSRYPYLVYWEVRGSEVWIVHVRHASRDRP